MLVAGGLGDFLEVAPKEEVVLERLQIVLEATDASPDHAQYLVPTAKRRERNG